MTQNARPTRHAHSSRPRRLPRPNAIIGRVVPLLLLLYVIYTYRLVVVVFLYEDVALRRRRPLVALLYGIYLHAHFVLTVLAYVRVYTAKPSSSAPSPPPSTNKPLLWFLHVFTPFSSRISLPRIPAEASFAKIRKDLIHQCDSDGELVRCYRDQCNGTWKPARTRHCGDCKTCRIGFDHHCPWFDADILGRSTMPSFLLFLTLGGTLLLSALLPLLPRAYTHFRTLQKLAWTDEHIYRTWWSSRWSWAGGPTGRYAWPLVLAQRQLRAMTSARLLAEERSREMNPEVSLYAPTILFIAILLILVVIGLILTTLYAAVHGDLSVDTQRRRAGLDAGAGGTIHFFVPLSRLESVERTAIDLPPSIRAADGVVVPTQQGDRPYDWGLWRNLQLILEQPHNDKDLMQWPISPQLQRTLIERARKSIHENSM